MRGHRVYAVGLALTIAIGTGAAIGAASQMVAVNAGDPRTGPIPPAEPSPTSEPSPTPSTTPEPMATGTPEPTGGQVWLYTLAEGDSLSGLAIRYGTTTEELLTLNPEYADNQDLVEVGAQVIMPCTPLAQTEDRC